MSANFAEVEQIRDTASVVYARITARERRDGERLYSFSIAREFDDNGAKRETVWMHLRHIKAMREALDRVEQRLRELEGVS
jgi:hypothetical protein